MEKKHHKKKKKSSIMNMPMGHWEDASPVLGEKRKEKKKDKK